MRSNRTSPGGPFGGKSKTFGRLGKSASKRANKKQVNAPQKIRRNNLHDKKTNSKIRAHVKRILTAVEKRVADENRLAELKGSKEPPRATDRSSGVFKPRVDYTDQIKKPRMDDNIMWTGDFGWRKKVGDISYVPRSTGIDSAQPLHTPQQSEASQTNEAHPVDTVHPADSSVIATGLASPKGLTHPDPVIAGLLNGTRDTVTVNGNHPDWLDERGKVKAPFQFPEFETWSGIQKGTYYKAYLAAQLALHANPNHPNDSVHHKAALLAKDVLVGSAKVEDLPALTAGLLGYAQATLGQHSEALTTYRAYSAKNPEDALIRALSVESGRTLLKSLDPKSEEYAQVNGRLRIDEAMLLALNQEGEAAKISEARRVLLGFDPQQLTAEQQVFSGQVLQLGLHYLEIAGGLKNADPQEVVFIQDKLQALAGACFGALKAGANKSQFELVRKMAPVYEGLEFLATGKLKEAQAKFLEIEEAGYLQLGREAGKSDGKAASDHGRWLFRGMLAAKEEAKLPPGLLMAAQIGQRHKEATHKAANLAVLEVWTAHCEEAGKNEIDHAKGAIGMLVESLEQAIGTEPALSKIEKKWAQEKLLIGEVRRLLEEDPAIRTVAQAIETIKAHSQVPGLSKFASDRFGEDGEGVSRGYFVDALIVRVSEDGWNQANEKGDIWLNNQIRFSETERKLSHSAYAAYTVLNAFSPSSNVREEAAKHMDALTGKGSFGLEAFKVVTGTSPEQLAVEVLTMQAAIKVGMLAKLATLQRLERAGVTGLEAVMLARAAGVGAETSALWAMHTAQGAMMLNVKDVLAPERMARSYGATLIMIAGLKAFGSLGESVGVKFAGSLGLLAQTGKGLSPMGQKLLAATGHAAGLSGMMATGKVNEALGLTDSHPGGAQGFLAQNILGYSLYALAQGSIGGGFKGNRSLHLQSKLAEAQALASGFLARSVEVKQRPSVNDVKDSDAITALLGREQLLDPQFSLQRLQGMIAAKDYHGAQQYLIDQGLPLTLTLNGGKSTPQLHLHEAFPAGEVMRFLMRPSVNIGNNAKTDSPTNPLVLQMLLSPLLFVLGIGLPTLIPPDRRPGAPGAHRVGQPMALVVSDSLSEGPVRVPNDGKIRTFDGGLEVRYNEKRGQYESRASSEGKWQELKAGQGFSSGGHEFRFLQISNMLKGQDFNAIGRDFQQQIEVQLADQGQAERMAQIRASELNRTPATNEKVERLKTDRANLASLVTADYRRAKEATGKTKDQSGQTEVYALVDKNTGAILEAGDGRRFFSQPDSVRNIPADAVLVPFRQDNWTGRMKMDRKELSSLGLSPVALQRMGNLNDFQISMPNAVNKALIDYTLATALDVDRPAMNLKAAEREPAKSKKADPKPLVAAPSKSSMDAQPGPHSDHTLAPVLEPVLFAQKNLNALSATRKAEVEKWLNGRKIEGLSEGEKKDLLTHLAEEGWKHADVQALITPEGMKYYLNYGVEIPFGFETQAEYARFQSTLIEKLEAAGVPVNDPQIEIVIQGSSAVGATQNPRSQTPGAGYRWSGNPAAADKTAQPSDLEVSVIFWDPAGFEGFVDRRKEFLDRNRKAQGPDAAHWTTAMGGDGKLKESNPSKALKKAYEKKILTHYNLDGALQKVRTDMMDAFPERNFQLAVARHDAGDAHGSFLPKLGTGINLKMALHLAEGPIKPAILPEGFVHSTEVATPAVRRALESMVQIKVEKEGRGESIHDVDTLITGLGGDRPVETLVAENIPDLGSDGFYTVGLHKKENPTITTTAGKVRFLMELNEKATKAGAEVMPSVSSGWILGGHVPLHGQNIGRFYFALSSSDHAADFFIALDKIYKEVSALPEGNRMQFKVPMQTEKYARADAGVLYFEAASQEVVLKRVRELARDHPGWFRDENPSLTTRVLDREGGKPLKGISFGMDVGQSYSGEVADIIASACSQLKAAAMAGQRLSVDDVYNWIATRLHDANFDLTDPAFLQKTPDGIPGRDLFKHIYDNTTLR